MTNNQSWGKQVILEFIDFIRYKIANDTLTFEEADSIAISLENSLNLTGTAEDLSKFYGKTKTNVTTIIDRKMLSCDYNCGFTYSNPFNKRAVVLIGPTTSGAEFLDTLVHEIHHLSVAIASELGVDLEGESPAYLSGDSARALADVVCKLGCGY